MSKELPFKQFFLIALFKCILFINVSSFKEEKKITSLLFSQYFNISILNVTFP